jgi:hypothetical protein
LSVDLQYREASDAIWENSTLDQPMLESLAAKLDMPISFKLLYESDIWIYDTGASSLSTNNKLGTTNKRS